MASKLIGYVRVSTSGQDYERQVADVLSAGVRRDDLYADKVSGSRSSRPGLDAALDALQEGDTLVVCTLDRLGRNVPHMLKMADELQWRNVELRVLNLGGGVVDTATPTGRLMFTVMAALAEMEYNIKAERNRDSVAKRRAKGLSLGGRPRAIGDDAFYGIMRDIESGMSATEACRRRNVGRSTFYREREVRAN